MLNRCVAALIVGLMVVLIGVEPCAGQSTAQFPVQFDFTTPGARSMALGGAFVGVADDATAAHVNPAGLAFLGTREVSLEGRFTSVKTPFLAGGRLSGAVTGRGLDTLSGPLHDTTVHRRVGPTYVSVIVPAGKRATITGYRHELVRSKSRFFSNGVFQALGGASSSDDTGRELPLGGSRDLSVTSYGVTVGVRINDKLAIGGGGSLATFELAADFARYGLESNSFSAPDRALIGATASQRGDGLGAASSVGVLWKATDQTMVGLAYRRGPALAFTQRDTIVFPPVDLTRRGRFKVPDVLTAGVSWRAGDALAVLDVSRVWYSQLKTDFIDIQALASGRPERLRLDDGTEVRAGLEYLFEKEIAPKKFIAIIPRLGVWFDPDHSVRYVPTPARDGIDERFAAALPERGGLTHFTFGVGLAWTPTFEVHAGADVSSRTRQVTVTTVKRFPRKTALDPTQPAANGLR